MPKRLNTARELGWHMGRSLGYQIKERDCLTRFSHAWGPLCRWPGATVEQVEKRVRDELALLRQVLRQNHGAVMLGQEQNAP